MTHGITKSGFDILVSRLQHKQLELVKLQEEISSIQATIKLRHSFLPEDFRLVATKLKSHPSNDLLYATIVSNLNLIRAALDIAASANLEPVQ